MNPDEIENIADDGKDWDKEEEKQEERANEDNGVEN